MKKGILIVLDGYGEDKAWEYNAVTNAKSPFLHSLKEKSHSLVKTDGEAVGLFKGDMGGSEVGHMTIGAGKIVPSTAKQIQDDITNGAFAKKPAIVKLIKTLKDGDGDLHLVGLMSDKNIHSNIAHAIEIVRLAKTKAKNIYIHFITDGRDSGPYDSIKYYNLLLDGIKGAKNCHIASVSGRFYSMDREGNHDRIIAGFNVMFNKQNHQIDEGDIVKYLKTQHDAGNKDQYVEPVQVRTNFEKIKDTDCLFFFNFREDRLRQMVSECKSLPCEIYTMSNVGEEKTEMVYPSKNVEHTLSQHLSELGLKQVKISESTKYAHVTFFLDGGLETPFKNEDRIHIPTIKVKQYDEKPKMRAKEITNAVCKSIKSGYDAIIVNYSNPDMIGHTGNYEATVKAIEFIDKCLVKLVKTAKKNGYFVLITADHGNAETMRTKDGVPHMAHTLNRVFCSVIDVVDHKMKKYGELKDIAPTFLDLMDAKPNKYFEGKSLIL